MNCCLTKLWCTCRTRDWFYMQPPKKCGAGKLPQLVFLPLSLCLMADAWLWIKKQEGSSVLKILQSWVRPRSQKLQFADISVWYHGPLLGINAALRSLRRVKKNHIDKNIRQFEVTLNRRKKSLKKIFFFHPECLG